jgi:hypothetical protein
LRPLKHIYSIGIKGFNRIDNADSAPDGRFLRSAADGPVLGVAPSHAAHGNLFRASAFSQKIDLLKRFCQVYAAKSPIFTPYFG